MTKKFAIQILLKKIVKHYYPRITIKTVSNKLGIGVKRLLEKEDFSPSIYAYQPKKKTEKLKYTLQINGKDTLLDWINKISPKNTTKLSRFDIWKKFGFCPPNTTYKQHLEILKNKINPHIFYKGL